MSDSQFAVLISVIGAGLSLIGAAIKWSVGRLVTSLDTNTAAHLTNAKAMQEMSTKLDFVYNAQGRVNEFIREEISGVHSVDEHEMGPQEQRSRADREKTPTGRKTFTRIKTNPGDR